MKPQNLLHDHGWGNTMMVGTTGHGWKNIFDLFSKTSCFLNQDHEVSQQPHKLETDFKSHQKEVIHCITTVSITATLGFIKLPINQHCLLLAPNIHCETTDASGQRCSCSNLLMNRAIAAAASGVKYTHQTIYQMVSSVMIKSLQCCLPVTVGRNLKMQQV